MTTASVSSENMPAHNTPVHLWLKAAAVWHILLALGALAGIIWLWLVDGGETAVLIKVVATVVLALVTLFSFLAAVDLFRLNHRGRIISLAINYLLFLFCLFGVIHRTGGFIGINGLADNFGRSLPFLFLAFIGILVSSLGETPSPTRKLAGRIITLLGTVAFLVMAGIGTAVRAFFLGLTDPLTLIMFLAIIPFGLFIWAIWRQPAAALLGAKNSDDEMLIGWAFLSPNLLGFLIFIAGPLLFSLFVSFTNWDAFGNGDYVGLANYARALNLTVAPLTDAAQRANEALDITVYDELTRITIFGRSFVIGAQDKLFWIALGNTLKFVLLAVPFSVIPALLLANLLNSKIPGMKFFRAVYFLPSVAAVVGIALVWQWLFNATIGYINYFITLATTFLGTTDPQVRWLSESSTALIAVVIMASWQWIGFNTVLFLAGLQSIPRSLYEAATVDGADSLRQFTRITIPLLAPTTFFVLVTTTIQSMQIFEQVFIVMGINPAGPANSTLTLVLYLYQKGFQRFEQGYASSIAWILFALIFAATLFQVQRQRMGDGGGYDM
ncbi:MAG: sugar ABC transporter permease [Anaerolineae bacterium]|nr:sugar ABC transporter permease [Anaerolineae bacterium]